MSDNRPIGVFDSGVGGLTVLQALQRELPHESTVYLGDLARCPYGRRPQEEVRRFALQIGDLLESCEVKLLVVACNTATAAAISDLQERYQFPVVGVIRPGAEAALRLSQNRHIGVIATDGTVHSLAYVSVLQSLSPDVTVVQRSASWLVPMIERGVLARSSIAQNLAPALDGMRQHHIDTLILGCTHFPLVADIFQEEVGPEIIVVDSAITTAREVARLLAARGLAATARPRHRLLVTGPAHDFAIRAETMFHESPQIESIDLLAGHAS